MSDTQIYKDHYELQQAHNMAQLSLQNIYNALFPHVSPEGVQLSLQEVVELTVQKLSRFVGEAAEKIEEAVEAVVEKE